MGTSNNDIVSEVNFDDVSPDVSPVVFSDVFGDDEPDVDPTVSHNIQLDDVEIL